jgi:hypothetical protein
VPFVVTGISPDGNTADLEAAIKAAGLSLEAFEVIGPDDADLPVSGGIAGSGIITGGGLETGTGVPGLTGSGIPGVTSAPADMAELIGGSLWDRLADLAIPDDEVENYAEALEAGRSIVAYHGTTTSVPLLESMFASHGLTKIKTF